jgi:hypothetical protein
MYFYKWSKIANYEIVKLYTYTAGVPMLYMKVPENKILKRIFIPMASAQDIDMYKYLKLKSESSSEKTPAKQ